MRAPSLVEGALMALLIGRFGWSLMRAPGLSLGGAEDLSDVKPARAVVVKPLDLIVDVGVKVSTLSDEILECRRGNCLGAPGLGVGQPDS